MTVEDLRRIIEDVEPDATLAVDALKDDGTVVSTNVVNITHTRLFEEDGSMSSELIFNISL